MISCRYDLFESYFVTSPFPVKANYGIYAINFKLPALMLLDSHFDDLINSRKFQKRPVYYQNNMKVLHNVYILSKVIENFETQIFTTMTISSI